MKINLFGKEWIIINEEIAIYLSFLIVLTILINNLGKTLVNSFTDEKKIRFKKIKISLNCITFLSILISLIYIVLVNWDAKSFELFVEKFYIRYLIYNLFFLLNILFLMSEKLAQHWYFLYIIQLIILSYLNRDFLFKFDLNDLFVFLIALYILLVFGMVFQDKFINFMKVRYEKGILAQNKFYNETLNKLGFINDIIFFRNVFVINFGSWQAPEVLTFGYWVFYSSLLLIVTFLATILAYKILFTIAITCISLNYGYETLHDNYKDSEGFKRNFDENKTKWLNILSNNDIKVFGVTIKRNYSKHIREHIKMSAENVGSVTMTNPRTRNLIVLGKVIVVVGGFAVAGTVLQTYIHEKAEVAKHQISVNADVEKHAITEKARFDFIAEQEKARNDLNNQKVVLNKISSFLKK